MNPFEHSNATAQAGGDSAKRITSILIVLSIMIPLAICTVTIWFVFDYVKKARQDIEASRVMVSGDATKTMTEINTLRDEVRKLKVYTELRADQTRKYYDAFLGMHVEAVNRLTNTSLELQRRSAYLLTEQTRTNAAQLDATYTTRLRELGDKLAMAQEAMQRDYQDKLKQVTASLQKYDKLLKLDPDLDRQVAGVRSNLVYVMDFASNLFMAFNTVADHMGYLTNRMNQMDGRFAKLAAALTNPPPVVVQPALPTPTPTPTPKPAPQATAPTQPAQPKPQTPPAVLPIPAPGKP